METPVKPAQQPRVAPARVQQGARPPVKGKKPRKKMRVTFGGILSMLLLLMILAGAGLLYFDYGGVRDVFISFFHLEEATRAQLQELDTQSAGLTARSAELDARSAELDEREADIKTLEDASDAREKELTKRAEALDAKEQDLLTREQTLQTRTAEVEALAQQIDGWKVDIEAAAKMYEQMDAVIAAQTLSVDADPAQIARLLLKMDSAKAAAILEEFSKNLRKQVTDEMAP